MELLASGFEFPEAPVWYADHVWVSDVAGGGVHRIASDGSRSSWLGDRKGIGGMVVHRERLIASGRDLVDVISGNTLVSRPSWATGYNDIGQTPQGEILAGLLTFRPFVGEEPRPGYVARIDLARPPEQQRWKWRDGVVWPNGIAVNSDHELFVADFATGQLLTGLLGEDRPWHTLARSPSGQYDGIALDPAGNIWLATGVGATVECRAPSGKLLATVNVPADFVSSVCFAGSGADRLVITCSGNHVTDDDSGAVFATRV